MEICVGFEAHARILVGFFLGWGEGVAGSMREMSKLVTIYM